MARYCPLFSGSEGNCTYIGGADSGILIDAGVSARRIETALRERGIDPGRIAAVFVTHEHADHVSGLRVLTRRYGMRVYATPGTLEALAEAGRLTADTDCRPVEPDAPAGVAEGGCLVTAFSTPHDSRQSCGYCVHTPDGRQVAMVTDIGYMSDTVRAAITGCELIHIESNHDRQMLRAGGYPDFLKQRILGRGGHLANDACAAELFALAQHGASRFVLAHLSRQNNRPELAYETSRAALAERGLREGADYLLRVAAPVDTGEMWVF